MSQLHLYLQKGAGRSTLHSGELLMCNFLGLLYHQNLEIKILIKVLKHLWAFNSSIQATKQNLNLWITQAIATTPLRHPFLFLILVHLLQHMPESNSLKRSHIHSFINRCLSNMHYPGTVVVGPGNKAGGKSAKVLALTNVTFRSERKKINTSQHSKDDKC